VSRLSERDYLGILEVVRLAAVGTAEEPLPRPALVAALRLFPNAMWITFCEGPVADRRIRRLWTLAPPPSQAIRDANDAFRYQDPLKATTATLGLARRTSDVIDRRALHRLDLYQQVLRLSNIEHSLDFCLRPAGMPLIGWGLDSSDRDFSDRDRDVFEVLGRQLAALMTATRQRPATTRGSMLTARETAILTLIAEGRGNRDIAALLEISPSTVRTHLEHAFLRLGVQTRAAAVAAAFT
jgi:DNA-binding CsgD family transcriptional regulator